MSDLERGDLVDRDTGPDVGAVGLERVRPGEEAGQRSGVVAPLVPHRRRVLLGQSAQDEQFSAERFQRLERRGQAEPRAGLRGRPVGHVHAVGDVEEGHPPGDRGAPASSPRETPGTIASSQGRARAVPTPRKTVRRESRTDRFITGLLRFSGTVHTVA